MNFFRLLLTFFLMSALFVQSSWAGTTHSYSFAKKSYSGSKDRQYKVYEPSGLSGSAPMVMLLHGCKQDNNDALNDWGMKAAADANGFILVTPFITSWDGFRNQNCWGFWFQAERHEGGGEVQDLVEIAKEVEGNFSIDSDRRYITGLSSGGAMTVVAAVAHNEYWSAAASASGLPYGEDAASVSLSGQCPGNATFHSVSKVASDMEMEINDTYKIPMMVLANESDCTVIQPAGRNIRDAHLRVFGEEAFNTPTEAQASDNACNPYHVNNYSCRHKTYTQDGTTSSRSVVETVFFDGPLNTANPSDTNHGHYWVGGADGNEGKWAVKKGPSYPDIIWDFFNRHSRSGSSPIGKPVITMNGDNPMTVNLNDSFTDPGATADDAEDGSLPVTASCSVNTSVVGEYYCNYTATDSDSNTSAATRTVNVIDPTAPIETCAVQSSSPSAHISAGRAVKGGSFDLRALSNGDNADIGASFDTWSSVTLTEGVPGNWYAQPPAVCNGGSSGGGGSGFACADWYASNLSHQLAGRAYYSMGYYSTGGNDGLGALSGTYGWVKETASGVFEAGQCP